MSVHLKNGERTIGVQLFWRPLKRVGLGLYGFGNLNSEESLLGAVLDLQLLFR